MGNYNNATVVAAVGDGDYLHVTTSGGQFRRAEAALLIAKAKAQTLAAAESSLLDRLTDGCFVMYHSGSSEYAVKASEWAAKQSSGETADGVLLSVGGRHLVIAPTQGASMPWGSSNTLVGEALNDREEAFADFSGKDKTSAIVGSSAYAGDGASYAPGFCAAYSRGGLGAGKWWLPSLGELQMVLANRDKINLCLALIDGAQQIGTSAYWSITEVVASWGGACAWFVDASDMRASSSSRTAGFALTRPVSYYYK